MIVASFTPRDRQRIIVSGLGQPFAASISAVYNDGSAFIIRDAEGRIAIVRSNPHLGQWCIGRIQPGETVLEPSAGTGAIVREIIAAVDTEIVGYDINPALVSKLTVTFPSYRLQARCRDFLKVTEGMGQFPVVLMNPPFVDAQDIVHIRHAMKFLRPGGRLVAICANGSRQQAKLKPIMDTGEDLPSGTFKESGTGVNAALVTYTRRPEVAS